MKLCLISDTHSTQLSKLELIDADVLVHAGDATGLGYMAELSQFNNHLGEIKHRYKHIIYVPGNHDFGMEEEKSRKLITNAHVLINEAITLDGVKFFGSPICPPFGDWAFYLDKNARWELWNRFRKEHADTDVLVTHGPAYGIGDRVARVMHRQEDPNVGCKALLKAVKEVKPELHVHGHIHEAYGKYNRADTVHLCPSIMTLRYQPTNLPMEFTLATKTR